MLPNEVGRTILAEYDKIGYSKNIVGFIDDDFNKIDKIFNGKMVLAHSEKIMEIIAQHNIDEVIISLPSDSSERINNIVLLIKKSLNKYEILKLGHYRQY